MRLAFKAQGQCRTTLETLAAIKNPPTVFARQANIAHGPQQVNNSVPLARAGNPESGPNELLEAQGERLDIGSTSAAGTGIRRWRPWDRSTGPRTADGKARSGRNAYRGAQRLRWRELVRALNSGMRAHRQAIVGIMAERTR